MSTAQYIQDPRVSIAITISSGASVSSGIALMGYQPVALVVANSTWSSAAVSFLGCHDDTSYVPVYNDTAEVSLSSALAKGMGKTFAFRTDFSRVLGGYSFIKVRSGLAASAVNQAKDVPMVLIVAPYNG